MHKSLIDSVASAVRYFRKKKMSQPEELANKSKLDRTYISGVERGVRNITIEVLGTNINKALDITEFRVRFCNKGL